VSANDTGCEQRRVAGLVENIMKKATKAEKNTWDRFTAMLTQSVECQRDVDDADYSETVARRAESRRAREVRVAKKMQQDAWRFADSIQESALARLS